MMRSLFSAVAGLKNHQTKMDVIGNNIANVNTAGFKSGRVTFQDTLSQTLTSASSASGTRGGTNPKQIGLGVGIGSIDTIFTNGSVQSTGKNTDLCLSGAGFFVVNDGNSSYYTRDGAFEFDEKGNYCLPGNGLKVQGWMGTNGVIDTTAAPKDIVVAADTSMTATATTSATYSKNLSADTPTISSITPNYGDGSTGTMITTGSSGPIVAGATTSTQIKSLTVKLSDGSTKTVTTTGYTGNIGYSLPISTSLTVYDSLGTKYSVPLTLTKTATPNTWQADIAANAVTGATNAAVSVPIAFNPDGSYKSGAATLALTAFTNGAAKSSISIDFSKLTQYAGESTAACTDYDGYAAGSLKSVAIDSSGIITGTFTNNQKRSLAQVAIATFNNPAGLEKSGSSLYSASNNSGKVQISTVTASGSSLTPSALEMSNVDLSNEFSDMIVTQRGFQSNSKIITVSDEMLDTLISMKR